MRGYRASYALFHVDFRNRKGKPRCAEGLRGVPRKHHGLIVKVVHSDDELFTKRTCNSGSTLLTMTLPIKSD